MQTMKVMSIIGVVWFSLMFLTLCVSDNTSSIDEIKGIGILISIYAIPYSIVGIVLSSRSNSYDRDNKLNGSVMKQLLELVELKKNGILSEEEFDIKKKRILISQ